MSISTILPRSTNYLSREIVPTHPAEASVVDRQKRIPGFRQEALENIRVMLIGAGGLGGEIGHGLARKGIGTLKICDGDVVELSNLNRQRFFAEDLYRNKAVCLAKNLCREATRKTRFIAYPCMFQAAVIDGLDVDCDVAICGVDNSAARVSASKYYCAKEVPVIVTAVSTDAEHGYVFVQESRPGQPCFGCLFPDEARGNRSSRCPDAAAPDILKVVAGIVLYAVDSLVMDRKRNWKYKEIFLAGFGPDGNRPVERREDCPLCGR